LRPTFPKEMKVEETRFPNPGFPKEIEVEETKFPNPGFPKEMEEKGRSPEGKSPSSDHARRGGCEGGLLRKEYRLIRIFS